MGRSPKVRKSRLWVRGPSYLQRLWAQKCPCLRAHRSLFASRYTYMSNHSYILKEGEHRGGEAERYFAWSDTLARVRPTWPKFRPSLPRGLLGWLDECRPLREVVKQWIVAQGEMQKTMREGLRQFFPDLKSYHIGEDQDGNRVMAEMTPEDQAAYDAQQNRQHESLAQWVEQYELNLDGSE
jgi:hypothetical protein